MELLDALVEFKERVNDSKKMKPILKKWEPNIFVESIDAGSKYTLLLRKQGIIDIVDKREESSHLIHIRSKEDMLIKIFSGEINPAKASLDGKLEVFSNPQDEMKLDAMSLVIWGV